MVAAFCNLSLPNKLKLKCTPFIVQWRYDLGFKDVKAGVLACLNERAVLHAERSNIDIKTYLRPVKLRLMLSQLLSPGLAAKTIVVARTTL